eukprot:gene9446-19623_t
MIVPTILLSLAFLVSVRGGCVTCPNQCSGHGTCGLNFVCTCYDNYGMGLSHDSGDCSERMCPYELAWVDTPDKKGRRHKYAECAGRGICNRDSGECECFAGYEGKACARTTCPNGCSGHGRCTNIQDMTYAASPFDYAQGTFVESSQTFDYYAWDNSKTRGCVCDPGFGDADCSKRICPYGTDIMDHRLNMNADQLYQTQKIVFVAESTSDAVLDGKTFALTFKSKLNETFTTIPIVIQTTEMQDMVSDVQNALHSLPNGVIDEVQVHGLSSGSELYLNITFTGDYVQGPQYLLTVETALCGDGCTPKLSGVELHPLTQNVTEVSLADFNSYECGRRGKCDYTSGVCQCFEGYTGPACGGVTALI